MKIDYFLCNPTENITALVETFVPTENQPEVAEYIMKNEPTCEQVGYLLGSVEGSDITLRMAGGEFCGNATMSTAAYFCKVHGLGNGEKTNVKVKVIGVTDFVNVMIENRNGEYIGTVEMPKPLRVFEAVLPFEDEEYKLPVVEFSSISHIIVDGDIPHYLPEKAIKFWCDRLKAQGLGIIIIDKDGKTLRPLVYVKEPEGMTWESSCASGTTAAGAYLYSKSHKPFVRSFKEPGGVLQIEVTEEEKLLLTGSVKF